MARVKLWAYANVVLIVVVDNAKLEENLSDDELPLFIGNNNDIGLCLAMSDCCCEVM